jgi:hypothetical protein
MASKVRTRRAGWLNKYRTSAPETTAPSVSTARKM